MFVNGGVSLAFTVGRQRHPDEVSGTVSGTINSVGYFGAAVVPAVMGMVLDVFWTGKIVDGTPVYSFTGYRVAFGISPQLPASRPSRVHSGFTRLDGQDSVVRPAYRLVSIKRPHAIPYRRTPPFSACVHGDPSGAGTASMPLPGRVT